MSSAIAVSGMNTPTKNRGWIMKKILIMVVMILCVMGCKKRVKVHDPITGAAMVLTLQDSAIEDALNGGYKVELLVEVEEEK